MCQGMRDAQGVAGDPVEAARPGHDGRPLVRPEARWRMRLSSERLGRLGGDDRPAADRGSENPLMLGVVWGEQCVRHPEPGPPGNRPTRDRGRSEPAGTIRDHTASLWADQAGARPAVGQDAPRPRSGERPGVRRHSVASAVGHPSHPATAASRGPRRATWATRWPGSRPLADGGEGGMPRDSVLGTAVVPGCRRQSAAWGSAAHRLLRAVAEGGGSAGAALALLSAGPGR